MAQQENRIKYYNLYLNVHDTASALAATQKIYAAAACKKLFFVNAHCFNIAQKSKDYFDALSRADLVLNDGIGIELGARLAGIHLKENMNGTDFTPLMLKQAAKLNKKVFFLGSKPGVPEETQAILEKNIQGIQITGVRDGYFSPEDSPEIVEQINRSKAELLLVGMGVPRQELWIDDNAGQLSHVKIAAAIGAAFDFISGQVTRAPMWMRKMKLEWLFRFLLEPGRMFQRYFLGNFVFFFNILHLKGK